jgi:hypothetical protein
MDIPFRRVYYLHILPMYIYAFILITIHHGARRSMILMALKQATAFIHSHSGLKLRYFASYLGMYSLLTTVQTRNSPRVTISTTTTAGYLRNSDDKTNLPDLALPHDLCIVVPCTKTSPTLWAKYHRRAISLPDYALRLHRRATALLASFSVPSSKTRSLSGPSVCGLGPWVSEISCCDCSYDSTTKVRPPEASKDKEPRKRR